MTREKFDAVIFDLDGVITQTAKVHAGAWKEMFDTYLSKREEPNKPFDIKKDYGIYIDGKPRYEGVKSFLEARDIRLPWGSPEDSHNKETICGLGNWKNQLFQKHLKKEAVEVYTSSVSLIRTLSKVGFKVALVSSSKNCSLIVESAKVGHLFDLQIDGVMAEKLKLKGKPNPDVFLHTAKMLNVRPERAVVVEDSFAGVKAGYDGHFGYVIGVDRKGEIKQLKQSGADIVVSDLEEVEVEKKT